MTSNAAQAAIKVAQAALLPSVSAVGPASRSVQTDTTFGTSYANLAQVAGQATIPISDGRRVASPTGEGHARPIPRGLDQVRVQNDAALITTRVTNEGTRLSFELPRPRCWPHPWRLRAFKRPPASSTPSSSSH